MAKVVKAADGDLAALFAKLDRDGSGEISSAELRGGLRRVCGASSSAISDDEIDSLAAHLDKDGDGTVSLEELHAFVGGTLRPKKKTTRTTEELLMMKKGSSFLNKAPPGDGVDKALLISVREKMLAIAAGDLDGLFAKLDKDGSGHLDYDELKRGMVRRPKPHSLIDFLLDRTIAKKLPDGQTGAAVVGGGPWQVGCAASNRPRL